MKSLLDVINEGLQGITVTQYKNIWKGNFNVELNDDHFDNPTYFFTELLYAHKQSLPTTQEFTNVCKFIVDKMQHLGFEYVEKYFNEFCARFIEIFFPELYNHAQNNGKILLSNTRKSNISYIVFHAVFFGPKRLSIGHRDEQSALIIDTITNELNKYGKKYGLTAETWPDYTVGIEILRNALKRK